MLSLKNAEIYWTTEHRTTRDKISMAFFDQVALFSDFNRYLDKVLLPVVVMPLIKKG